MQPPFPEGQGGPSNSSSSQPLPAPATPASPRGKRRRRRVILIVAGVVATLLVLGGVGAVLLLPTFVTLPPGAVLSDIPLPPQSTFDHMGHPDKPGHTIWVYTVADTTVQGMGNFYKPELARRGWGDYSYGDFTSSNHNIALMSAKKGKRGLLILADADPGSLDTQPPPGGLVLVIELST